MQEKIYQSLIDDIGFIRKVFQELPEMKRWNLDTVNRQNSGEKIRCKNIYLNS